MQIINVHNHYFNGIKDVPKGFLAWPLRWMADPKRPVLNWILEQVHPDSDGSIARTMIFLQTSRFDNAQEIIDRQLTQYPEGTIFIAHSMDMAFMGAGEVRRPYYDQLKELAMFNPSMVIPFMHVDCRRKEHFGLFKTAVELLGFKGLKFYPNLGTFPYDPAYEDEFTYCEDRGLPVLSHCSPANPVHWKGSHKELKKLLEGYKLDEPIDWKKKDRDLCAYFADPRGWKLVMAKHPRLKVGCAHYGKGGIWDSYMREMMRQYVHFYVDISYSLYDKKQWPALKVLLQSDPIIREKVLFGTDYYMVQMECEEKTFCIELRAYLGEELWWQIANINPKRFLNIE